MSSFTNYLAIVTDPAEVLGVSPDFPHRLALLPDGCSLSDQKEAPSIWGVFLLEPGSMNKVLTGSLLRFCLAARYPVLINVRWAQDLRPLLRRANTLAACGYAVKVPGATTGESAP